MPNIPVPPQQVAARSTRQRSGGFSQNASPEDFGAGVARANATVGRAVSDLGGAAIDIGKDYAQKAQQQEVANKVAQGDFTREMLKIRETTGASGNGYQDAVLTRYDDWVEEQANEIDDDAARVEYRNRMMAQRPTISSNAAIYEYQTKETYGRDQATASLSQLQNKIGIDPSMYDQYVQSGKDVIASQPGLTQTQISAMQETWSQNAVYSRFQGQLEAATSAADIDAIALDLAGKSGRDWSAEFKPEDYERLVNAIGTTKSAFVTKADADARAAIETLDQRNTGLALIPQEEIAAVEEVVRGSKNPVTQAKFFRIMRDQELLRTNRYATPQELTARINAANGGPNSAFPGVPAQVSSSINYATQLFPGVSASYLGNTVMREYGGQFKTAARGKPEFAPSVTGQNVDLRNMQPGVVDALAVAGEEFGAPLMLNSGYRSQAKQDAIRANGDPSRPGVAEHSKHTEGTGGDISTIGMSGADKARLVTALVNAGFTGIGEYDTHIHADFRDSVPNTYGTQNGKAWGGWTFLSPEVASALNAAGFKAGASSSAITRKGSSANFDATDYTVGNSTSSAKGLFQFVDETFLDVMKGNAGRMMGIDVSKMSDAQILALRDDPGISTVAAAAYASQNKQQMESALGRSVDDGELYLAHFLGPGGAVALISSLKSDPRGSAAALLPKAANANKKLFFVDGRARTTRELYDEITMSFAIGPSQAQYGDVETMKKLRDNVTTGLKEDPMTLAADSGLFSVPDATQNPQQYGETVRSVTDYYGVSLSAANVLTKPVEQQFEKALSDGTVNDAIQVMSTIESMGSDVAEAAMRQLGEKNRVFGYAGGLSLATGEQNVATDIIRGQKRIQENPAIKDGIGATSDELTQHFNAAIGAGLAEINPADKQAIQDAAVAHYVETYVARNGGGGFNAEAFNNSVSQVLGGTANAPAVQMVNGAPTVLPRGIDAATLETAMNNMSVADWTAMSLQQTPPLDGDGNVIDPRDMAFEAQFLAVGNGTFKVRMGDGNFAITGNVENGMYEAWLFKPDSEQIGKIATRPSNVMGELYGTPTGKSTFPTHTLQRSWPN